MKIEREGMSYARKLRWKRLPPRKIGTKEGTKGDRSVLKRSGANKPGKGEEETLGSTQEGAGKGENSAGEKTLHSWA